VTGDNAEEEKGEIPPGRIHNKSLSSVKKKGAEPKSNPLHNYTAGAISARL
jgi:hypothetical protein